MSAMLVFREGHSKKKYPESQYPQLNDQVATPLNHQQLDHLRFACSMGWTKISQKSSPQNKGGEIFHGDDLPHPMVILRLFHHTFGTHL